MADDDIEFQEEPVEGQEQDFGFLPDETVAQFAIKAPEAIATDTLQTLAAGATGSEMGRQQLAARRVIMAPTTFEGVPLGDMSPEERAGIKEGFLEPGRIAMQGLEQGASALWRGLAATTETPLPSREGKPFRITRGGELREETPEEIAATEPGQPGVPLFRATRNVMAPEGSDLARLLEQNSTPGGIAMISAGGISAIAGAGILAATAPQILDDVVETARGTGSEEQKRDRINQLMMMALIAARHGAGFERPNLPPRVPEGIQPVPNERGRFVTAEGQRRILAPEIIDEPAPITEPLIMTGENLPGRPAGAVPIRATAGPEILAPPDLRPAEVPEVGKVETQESMLEEIRRKNARTRAEIQKVFPDLTREQAAELRNAVWGVPNADVGVVVGPSVPRPSPMRPIEPAAKAPEVPPDEFAAAQAARAAEEARQAAIDRSNIEQGIIFWERELDKHLKNGDQRGQDEAIDKLLDLRRKYEGPPKPTKGPIVPKQPLQRLPRATFPPRVPGTAAEVREPIIQEIQRRNLRTRRQILDAFPMLRQRKRANEFAAFLRDRAWGQPQPPENLGPYGQVTGAGQPGPKLPGEEPPGAPPEEPPAQPPGPTVPKPKGPAPVAPEPAAPAPEAPPQKPALPTIDDIIKMSPEDWVNFVREAQKTGVWDAKAAKAIAANLTPGHKARLLVEARKLGERAEKLNEELKDAILNNDVKRAAILNDAGMGLFLKAAAMQEIFDAAPGEIAGNAQKAIQAQIDAEAAAKKPKTFEDTEVAGSTIGEWEKVKDAKDLPKGKDPVTQEDRRAQLAKFLAVPNQPGRILQALANKKRTREIHAPTVPPAAPGKKEEKPTVPMQKPVVPVQKEAEPLQKPVTPVQKATPPVQKPIWEMTKDEAFQERQRLEAEHDRILEEQGAEAAKAFEDANPLLKGNWPDAYDQLVASHEPKEPTITAATLKGQKENLLEQVDAALKTAPEQGKGKVTFSVPGDGDFTISNTKAALAKFREVAKGFPSTLPSTEAKIGGVPGLVGDLGRGVPAKTMPVSTTKPGTPTPMPAAKEPKPDQRAKIVGRATSEALDREPIQTMYSDGQQLVATDGRQMIRLIANDLPGTPAKPVRLTPEGKPTEGVRDFPNFNAIIEGKRALVASGVDTAKLWQLANEANRFYSEYGDDVFGTVKLLLNQDRSLGAEFIINDKKGAPTGEQFVFNSKPKAYSLGNYQPDLLFSMADTARRLGNETVDLYADGEKGPLELVGKNHQHLAMPVSKPTREPPSNLPASLVGKSTLPRPTLGEPPIVNPEGKLSAEYGKWGVELEAGQFTIRDKQSGDRVTTMLAGEENKGDIAKALSSKVAQLKASDPLPAAIYKVMQDLIKRRLEAAKDIQRRQLKYPEPPGSVGPGAASPEEFEGGPSPVAAGVDPGNAKWNELVRRTQNFFGGMGQLFKRVPHKQDISQLANAADNLPRYAGQIAGNSMRLRVRPEERPAVTMIMQALKMSGDSLSMEDAARLGRLDYAGDPIGYLRTKKTDLETKAQEFIRNGQKLEANAAMDAAKAMGVALENYNRLVPFARRARKQFDAQIAREERAGVDVNYERWYVPQRHDLDLFPSADRPIILGHARGSGVATGFRKAKVFEDYASAIEEGFIPRSLDIADLIEHRVFQGERWINRKAFYDQLRGFRDPVDNNRMVINIPKRTITRPDGTIETQEAVPRGYTPHEIMPGMRVAVHNGYSRLVNALTASSQLAESGPIGTLADIAAATKHLSLAIDTFHASRTLQAELALTGRASLGARQIRGRALVEYGPADLNLAVERGLITREMADWIKTPQPIEINGRTYRLSPHAIMILGAKNGLNMARVADVMYRQWIRDLPIVGTFQKWVFDKMTRSAISLSFLHEFERVAKANPNLNATQVARAVASDINVFFGNLGKESFIKNPSVRTIANILLLAPQWVEALARREARAALQVGKMGSDVIHGRKIGISPVAKGMGNGLVAYFLGTQLANLWFRGHLTFQNPEEGHKLDAWIPGIPGLAPGGSKGFFLSPLSVFGEIFHDVWRYMHDKADPGEALAQIAENKLGPMGRVLQVAGSGRDPMTDTKLGGSGWEAVGRRAMAAGAQAVPIPIIASQLLRRAGTLAFPGQVRQPAPGGEQRQIFASFGLKTEPAPTATMQTYQMADTWKKASTNPQIRAGVERRLKEDFGPSDYRDLRVALLREDQTAAEEAYKTLLESKTPATIRQTMAHPHPFTGSQEKEAQFRAQLTSQQLDTYYKAVEERHDLNRRFQNMLRDWYAKQQK